MKKKGTTMSPLEIVAGFVVIGLVLAVSLYFLNRGTGLAGKTISSYSLKLIDEKCLLDTKNAAARGMIINTDNDKDQDGRLDVCDVCVCSSDVCANTQDSDLDGMFDYCDAKRDDPNNFDCRPGFTRTKNGRCVSLS